MRRVLPFDSGDDTQVDPSWPLAPGLVFAASLADGQGGNGTPVGGAKNLLTGVGTSSGLIHAASTPFGKGRRRTDGSSNFIWDYRERVDVGTGDFTAAVYGLPTIDGASVLNWFSNDTGANQWRILTDCNSSVAFAAGSLAFWTFDGSTTIVTAAGAMIARPAWYSAVRRGTTLEIWRNGALLASASGTARNVTGTKQGKIMLGSGTTNSRGLFGPALLWRRALTPTELQSLNPDSPFEFVKSQYRHVVVPAPAGGASAALTGVSATAAAGTLAPSISVALSGAASSATAGSVAAGSDVTTSLTGASATTAAGTLSASTSVALAGVSSTTATGTLAASISVALAGASSTAAAGTLSAGGDASAAVTGQAASTAQGTLGVTASGSAVLAGAPSTAATGALTAGISTALTGASAAASAGSLTAGGDVSVTIAGQAVVTAQGTVGVTATGAVTVALTGAAAVIAAGNIFVTAPVVGWTPVDDSISNAWIPVDDSNAALWT